MPSLFPSGFNLLIKRSCAEQATHIFLDVPKYYIASPSTTLQQPTTAQALAGLMSHGIDSLVLVFPLFLLLVVPSYSQVVLALYLFSCSFPLIPPVVLHELI